jgi:hypothetical protein
MTPSEIQSALLETAVPIVSGVPDHTTNKSVFVGSPQAFEDTNHNGVYEAGVDRPIAKAELQDGLYTTSGDNSLVIPAAVGPIAPQNQIELRTNGNLTVSTSLESASSIRLLVGGHINVSDVSLTSSDDQVLLEAGDGINADAARLTARKEVFIRGEGRMHFPESILRSTGERIEFDLAGTASPLTLSSATLTAQRDVIIASDADVTIAGAAVEAAEERASIHTMGTAVLSHATMDAMKKIIVNTGADIAAEGAALSSHNEVIRLISTNAAAQVALQRATLTTPKAIEVETAGTSGLLSVSGAAFSDDDDTVLVTPRCLPVDGVTASGRVADACDAEDGAEGGAEDSDGD